MGNALEAVSERRRRELPSELSETMDTLVSFHLSAEGLHPRPSWQFERSSAARDGRSKPRQISGSSCGRVRARRSGVCSML
jgi:hypothetical protein